MRYVEHETVVKRMTSRLTINMVFKFIFLLTTLFALLALGILFYRIISQGAGYITPEFFKTMVPDFQKKQVLKRHWWDLFG